MFRPAFSGTTVVTVGSLISEADVELWEKFQRIPPSKSALGQRTCSEVTGVIDIAPEYR